MQYNIILQILKFLNYISKGQDVYENKIILVNIDHVEDVILKMISI